MKKILIIILLIIILQNIAICEEGSLEEEIKEIIFANSEVKNLILDKDSIFQLAIRVRSDSNGNRITSFGNTVIYFPDEKLAYSIDVNLDAELVEGITPITYYDSQLKIAKPISYKEYKNIGGLEERIKEIVFKNEKARDLLKDEKYLGTLLVLFFYSEITEGEIGETKVWNIPNLSISADGKTTIFFVDLKEERVINIVTPDRMGAWSGKQYEEAISGKNWWIPFIIVISLIIIGILGVILNKKIKWAGYFAAWIFYIPVILGILAPMIIPFLGVGIFYLIWEPLEVQSLSFLRLGMYPYPYCPIPPVMRKAINIIGFILIALGFGVTVIGLWQIIRAKKVKRKEGGLIQTGLYSISRHPQYLGIIGWTLGIILISPIPRIMDFLLWTVLVLLHIFLADSEENKLYKEFGSEYIEYSNRVPYMLPYAKKFDQIFKFIPKHGWKRKFIEIIIYIPITALFLYILTFFALYPC